MAPGEEGIPASNGRAIYAARPFDAILSEYYLKSAHHMKAGSKKRSFSANLDRRKR